MKLIGFVHQGVPTIGRLDDDGQVAAVASIVDFYADTDHWLAMASKASLTAPLSELNEVPPVPEGAKVLCVGLNYAAHADEAGLTVPEHPTVFGRWASTLTTTGTEIKIPTTEPGLDWEVELAVIIGQEARTVSEDEADRHILGYTVFNDVSARVRQMETTQWTLGKNADGSGPLGPWLVTPDEFGTVDDKMLELRVNGVREQTGNTRDLIFSIPTILAYISETMTLRPGDVIATGTPDGVGFTRTPPRYLVSGDVVEAEVQGIGVVRNTIGTHHYVTRH